MRNLHIIFYAMLILLFGTGSASAEGGAVTGAGVAAGHAANNGDAGGVEGEGDGAAGDGTHNPYRAAGTPVNATQAIGMAGKVRDVMVQRGDLTKSWSSVKITEAKQRTFKNEKEWIIVLNNPKETEPGRKTLYIFLDTFGDVVDMNYTGE